jgi:hypothetical protein
MVSKDRTYGGRPTLAVRSIGCFEMAPPAVVRKEIQEPAKGSVNHEKRNASGADLIGCFAVNSEVYDDYERRVMLAEI